MIEREMEDLLWENPERLLHEKLKQFRRQQSSSVGRCDLIFENHYGSLLIVELKRGKLERGAIEQLHDYFGTLKREFPERPIELMVVANIIPEERRLACDRLNIDWREISDKRFRDLALETGYIFSSETGAAEPITSKSPENGTLTSQHLADRFGITAKRLRHILRSMPEYNDGLNTAYRWAENDLDALTKIEEAVKAASDNHSKVVGFFPENDGPIRKPKAWGYYEKRTVPVFLAFVNQKGSCSVRTFDAITGKKLEREYGSGDFQDYFNDLWSDCKALSLSQQPSLESVCKHGLPSHVLMELQKQIR